MADEWEAIDANSKGSLTAVSTADDKTIVRLVADPDTGALVVTSSGGSGTVTEIDSGTGIKLTPDPITTTGSVALVDRIAPIATLGSANQQLRVNAGATALEYFTPSGGSDNITVGTTTVTSGTTTRVLYNNAGVVGEYVISGTGNVAMTTSPVFTTPNLGTPSALVGTNITGTAAGLSIGGNAATATTATTSTNVTVANEATDTTCFPTFVTAATGDLGTKSNANLTFNSNTGSLAAASLTSNGQLNVISTSSTVLLMQKSNAATDEKNWLRSINSTNIQESVLNDAGTVSTVWMQAVRSGTTISSILFATGASTGTTALSLDSSQNATVAGNATARAFIPSNSAVPTNGLYLPAANTLGWAVNSAAEMQLTATALSPAVDGGNSLGTTTLGWQNLFANTGFVLNIENSDWVATHTAGILTVGTGDLRVTNNFTNATSVVTVGGAQTLTNKTLTSPAITTSTLTGAQVLNENASLQLDPAGSADGKFTGITVTAVSDYTQAFGDLVYLKASNSRWAAADADAATTAGPVALAMVVVTGTSGNACTLLLQGIIRADANFPTMTVGATQYVGETAGAIQGAIPTGADNVIRTVGYAITADELYFNPSTDWQISVS